MRTILGFCLVSLPFIVITAAMVANGGIALAAVVWGAVLAILVCVIGGIYLINPR